MAAATGEPVAAKEAEPPAEPLDGRAGRELLLRNFRPQPQLRVAETQVAIARFPVVDVHTHMFYRQRHNEQALEDFVALMDRNRIAVCASLDGQLGSQLEEHLDFLWEDYRNRFIVFANLDWMGDGDPDKPATWACNRPGWAERSAERLVEAAERGVSGLKIFKRFGLEYRDAEGKLLRIDDPRWDPIWEACGRTGLPVLIHTADPSAFFEPLGPENERWEELSRHPDWHFHGGDFPSRMELLEARNRVIARHPKTQFIGAHMANSAEDLRLVQKWLDDYPNLWVEPASRISELGRQPYTARDFLIRNADRVLFGTDGPWPETRVRLYWRFFETRDEYFPYAENEFPPQGFWRIYGVHLPDDVLRKIYHENAAKLIPGVAERLAAWREAKE
nr:amidohydrolase family protein [Candidatus Laterigemmans baculatus]